MPKQPRDIEQLLQDQGIKTILEYFLIRGGNQGIKFSEIKEYTGIEPSSTLYGKLQQLKRKNILSQKSKRGPYFLSGKYYNYVFHKCFLDVFSNLSPRAMAMPSYYAMWGKVIYGIHPEFLDKEDSDKLRDIYFELNDLLKEIKIKQVEKVLEKQKNKILSEGKKLRKEEKKFFWKFFNSESWIIFGSYLYTKFGPHPDKNKIANLIRRKIFPFDEEWKITLTTKILSLSLPFFDYIYPLKVGYFIYNDLGFTIGINKKLLPEQERDESERVVKKKNYTDTDETTEKEVERNYMDIYNYSISAGTKKDYLHYVDIKVEYARAEKYMIYAYGLSKKFEEADKKVEYWERLKKKLYEKLSDREKKIYEKKLLDWVKIRFAMNLYLFFQVDNIDALSGNPPNKIMDKSFSKRDFDFDILLSEKFWAKEYGRIKEGAKIRFGDIEEEEIKRNINLHRLLSGDKTSYDILYKELKDRVEYFLENYC